MEVTWIQSVGKLERQMPSSVQSIRVSFVVVIAGPPLFAQPRPGVLAGPVSGGGASRCGRDLRLVWASIAGHCGRRLNEVSPVHRLFWGVPRFLDSLL